MIKYHGTPCSPMKVFYEAFTDRNVLIPYPRPDDMKRAIEVADKIILDNGAFSIWKKGGIPDWEGFYRWVENHHDRIEFFFICNSKFHFSIKEETNKRLKTLLSLLYNSRN